MKKSMMTAPFVVFVDQPVKTKCNHIFCKNCLDRWLYLNNYGAIRTNCPTYCRTRLLFLIN
jgi:hypothetical protein